MPTLLDSNVGSSNKSLALVLTSLADPGRFKVQRAQGHETAIALPSRNPQWCSTQRRCYGCFLSQAQPLAGLQPRPVSAPAPASGRAEVDAKGKSSLSIPGRG